jgi:hypothetical protein
MSRIKVELEGLDELRSALDRADSGVTEAVEVAVAGETEAVADDMRNAAPVGDPAVGTRGDPPLSESIETTVEGTEGSATATADHAIWIEEGTSTRPAQPFAAPAASTSEAGRFRDRVTDEVRSRIG